MQRPRIRLRTMLVVVAVLALVMAVAVQSVRLQRALIREQQLRNEVEQQRAAVEFLRPLADEQMLRASVFLDKIRALYVKHRLPRGAAATPVDAKEAVGIAEQFVRENGYTDFVPIDLVALQPEAIEHGARDQWPAHRANTLLPVAKGIGRGAPNHPKGWTVGFAYVKPLGDSSIGRAVTMDEFGEHVRMQHKDLMLDSLESGAK
jgi:hypothetical protein